MDSSSAATLELEHLSVTAGDRTLLRDVSLEIPGGDLTVIVGGSGAGKSVLLRLIAGLLPKDSQAVKYEGRVSVSEGDAAKSHRIGIVFQNFALFDEWNALDNVQFAIDHRRDRAKRPTRTAAEWLSELRVDPKAKPSIMSGGQKQRLAIARTLAANPSIVLYDEPSSGLDHATGLAVAALIAETHRSHRQTSIIVTHDYDTMLGIADHCLLLDSHTASLVWVPKDQWPAIASRLQPVALVQPTAEVAKTTSSTFVESAFVGMDDFIRSVGAVFLAAMSLLWLPIVMAKSALSLHWSGRFFLHAMRLICGPSSWGYLAMAGAIIGFTSTYFTFRFLPFQLYSKPLLIEDLLGSIGFALYRILVPVLATILVAARCGAAIAADVGVKRYGSQIDAIQTFGIRPTVYLLGPTVLAFVIATPLLQSIAFQVASWVSLAVFTFTHPTLGPYFWQQHFYRNLEDSSGWLLAGWHWVLLKALVCGVGIAAISYHRGFQPKGSAGEVSSAITATVLWATLFVLIVHFVVALIEF